SQASIMSPDIILIAGFLLIFVHVRNYNAVLTGAILLASVSSRGAMVLAAAGSVQLIQIFSKKGWTWSQILKSGAAYVPGILVFLLFNLWHYTEKGWIGYHADSPWAPCFERVDLAGFLKNTGI